MDTLRGSLLLLVGATTHISLIFVTMPLSEMNARRYSINQLAMGGSFLSGLISDRL